MAAQATIVSVIASDARTTVTAVSAAATNVHSVHLADGAPRLDEVADVWRAVRSKPPIYALAPFDPFGQLVEAWADRLTGVRDDLELAVGLYPRVDPPDFYFVDEAVEDPHRSWYFELLFSEAPRRVLAFDGSSDDVMRRLRELTFGSALPGAEAFGALAREFIPGTRGLAGPI